MFNVETDILLLVNPLIKSEITIGSGKLILGRMWLPWEESHMLNYISQYQIDIIWNLRELSHNGFGNVQEVWSPIPDHGIPNNPQIFSTQIDTIIDALNSGKSVFVHCYGGKGRTSLAVASLLSKLNFSPEDALSKVSSLAHGPETQSQIDFVKSFLLPKS